MFSKCFLRYWMLMLMLKCIQSSEECDDVLKEQNIIPDIVPSCGSSDLKVVYEDGMNDVKCGTNVSVAYALIPPVLTFDNKDQCENVTVVLYDPLEILIRWLVYNVPASNLKNGFSADEGDTERSYVRPNMNLVAHKFVFFIYCQNHEVSVERSSSATPAKHVNILEFQKRNGFLNPVACNAMIVDNYDMEDDVSDMESMGTADMLEKIMFEIPPNKN